MAFRVGPNRFVVVERVQNLAFGALGGPFLLAYRAEHRESDEHFGHGTLLVEDGASILRGLPTGGQASAGITGRGRARRRGPCPPPCGFRTCPKPQSAR